MEVPSDKYVNKYSNQRDRRRIMALWWYQRASKHTERGDSKWEVAFAIQSAISYAMASTWMD